MTNINRLSKHITKKDLIYHNFRDAEAVKEYISRVQYPADPWKVNLNKTVYGWKCSTLIDTLQSRSIQSYLNRSFMVSSPSRHIIVDAIARALEPKIDMFVFRTDIKNFFGSIPTRDAINLIEKNHNLDHDCKASISRVLTEVGCVPKGWGPSSIIAELYLQKFDSLSITIPDTIACFRYVDDILIIGIGSPDRSTIEDYVIDLLPKKLSLSLTKTTLTSFTVSSTNKHFEYLGYKFTSSQCSVCVPYADKDRGIRTIKTQMADAKLSKLKTRVGTAFACYSIDGNQRRLIRTLKHLSHSVRLSPDLGLRKGLIHSYPLLNCTCQLQEVDKLLNAMIYMWSKSHRVGGEQWHSNLESRTIRILRGISFVNCYKQQSRYGN